MFDRSQGRRRMEERFLVSMYQQDSWHNDLRISANARLEYLTSLPFSSLTSYYRLQSSLKLYLKKHCTHCASLMTYAFHCHEDFHSFPVFLLHQSPQYITSIMISFVCLFLILLLSPISHSSPIQSFDICLYIHLFFSHLQHDTFLNNIINHTQ